MNKFSNALLSFILLTFLALPAMAQDGSPPAPQAAPQAQEEQMAEPEDEVFQEDEDADDDSPMCRTAGGHNCRMKAAKPGCMCGQDCGCPDCPMKAGGMGMGMMHSAGCDPRMCGKPGMGMDTMDGTHGDIDRMTWPRMNRSCRMPDYYLKHGDSLGLGENQIASLRKLDGTRKKEAILKGAQVKALELELSEIVTTADFKVSDAVAKLKEVEAARLELRTAMIKIAGSARDVLGAEQLEKLKSMKEGSGGMCGTRGGQPDKSMKKMMMEKMMRKNMGK